MSVAEEKLHSRSEVPWLDEFPIHWGIERGKSLFQKMKRPVRDEDETVTAFRDGQVTLRKNRRLDGFTEAIQEHGYQGIRAGDLVIHSMDAFAGAIGVSDSDGKASPVYQVCKPIRNDVNPRYFALLVRQMSKNGYILALAKGIRERSTDFRFSDFATQFYPLPPRAEQDAIVAFLDRKLADIDRFIANKRRMIALLEEEIVSFSSKALGASGKINSMQEWGRNLPAGWEMKRLKYISRIIAGISPHQSTYNESARGTVLVNGPVEFSPTSFGRTKETKWTTDPKKFAPKDSLLVCLRGSTTGRMNITNTEISIGRGVAAIVPSRSLEFLVYCLAVVLEFEKQSFKGSTFPSITTDQLGNYLVPWPKNEDEELEVVQKIELRKNQCDATIKKITRELDLMNEFRTALIAEAVTGKIDVQGVG